MQAHNDDATLLWRTLYSTQRGLIGVHSALRPAPGSRRLSRHRSRFFPYPNRAPAAAEWCLKNSEAGLEAYFCAHLLLARRRIKANAAPVLALWADADGRAILPGAPEPTAIVESSPGHAHLFWRLTRPVPPSRAEELNRRLLAAAGADRSGWDLSQLLRPPGTRNRKYEDSPRVRLLSLDAGIAYHPRELELTLPELALSELPLPADPNAGPPLLLGKAPSATVDLSRLSPRMRRLARAGNDGQYPSRSEADFAVAVAMFGKGYTANEVLAVLSDRSLGISEKAREQGRHAASYLARTVGKAERIALPTRREPTGRADPAAKDATPSRTDAGWESPEPGPADGLSPPCVPTVVQLRE